MQTLRKTHRFRQIGDRATVVLRTAPSIAAAARELGVNESSVWRWIRAGKITRARPAKPRRSGGMSGLRTSPSTVSPSVGPDQPGADLRPEHWGDAIREGFDLSPTEQVLVTLGEQSLAIAQDVALRPEQRLAGAARFQSIAKQLRVEDVNETEAAKSRSWPRAVDRSRVD